MAFASVTYTFTNGTAADATQVNTNFADLIAGTSDGTKDLNVAAITAGGTVTFNGDFSLSSGRIAANIPVKTNASYNLGAAGLGFLSLYLSMDATHTVRLLGATGGSTNYTITLPAVTGTIYDMLYSSDAASTLLWKKDSALSTNASGGTSGVTLTTSSTSVTVFNPSTAITVKLDNSFTAGRQITIINNGSALGDITVTANDNSTITVVKIGSTQRLIAPSASPATNTDWLLVSNPITPNTQGNALASALGHKSYYHGTSYNGGNAPTVTGPAGLAVTRAWFKPEIDSDGVWFLEFSVEMTHNSLTVLDIAIAGVTFSNDEACRGYAGAGLTTNAKTTAASGSVILRTSSAGTVSSVAGKARLSSKPNWVY